MISEQGFIKLCDFGLSTAEPVAHTLLGTPAYTAPEVINGDSYGDSCDVWAFGIILYELTHSKVSRYFLLSL